MKSENKYAEGLSFIPQVESHTVTSWKDPEVKTHKFPMSSMAMTAP